MGIARHLDALAIYRAGAVRVIPRDGDPEDLLGDGGGLEAEFERHGHGPLLEVLRDAEVTGILLGDGDLVVEVERKGGDARIRTRWKDRIIVDEVVEIPPAVAAPDGPTFRPDPASEVHDLMAALHDPSLALVAVDDIGGAIRWYSRGRDGRGVGEVPLRGRVPAIDPACFGAASFRKSHDVKWAYVAGEMAGGIGSAEMVLAMANAGLIGFFGAGGLPIEEVEKHLRRIAAEMPAGRPWGANLLHNPAEPAVEEQTVDTFLATGVRRASASAFMDLTPAVVRYRLTGIRTLPDGRIEVPNHVFAKLSRPEVADRFLRPASDSMLAELRQRGILTDEQCRMAAHIPLASDVTAEADSGGHTDRRPLVVLLPILQRLRDRVAVEEGYDVAVRPRVGAAGGLGTPQAVWAAFAMGADYVLTGSINQSAVEAGTSRIAKEMLAEATFTDVTTGPAPDMFEIGANVQVLSRGTMYAQRAQRLYELYRTWPSMDAIPAADRQKVEKQIFKRPLDEVWAGSAAYWQTRDPRQVELADKDPRHKMALTFRWYLGMTSRWARTGDEERKRDYQMWCGPAMGAFNEWAAGTELGPLEARKVARIAEALMLGAAAHARVSMARAQGLPVPPTADAVGVVG
jgi:trans-AT polyketide synthase/acyltransferase/oxidoreductase domain-containing protein